jgi:hypothetical protein
MRRRILMAVLAVGTVAGYGSGFAHMRHCSRDRHAAFEQHVAKVCVDAARGTGGTAAPAPNADDD